MANDLLGETGREGLTLITKKGGGKYTVRHDRRRYFFPHEYLRFIGLIKNKLHRFFYVTEVHTGGRTMEVLNLKHRNVDLDRGTITFEVVKQRTAKKNYNATGKSRSFFVGSEFLKEYKSLMRGKTIKPEEYIFLDNKKLPENYDSLNNKDRKKYYVSKSVSYSKMLKGYCRKAGIVDWRQFSLHNLRKTYGMWTRTFNIEMSELTYRMGHDMDTYLAHYGSSLIFKQDERRLISRIMGDVK